MINNYNMGVINSTDEHVKNIISGVASDLKVFLNIPKNTPIYVNNDIDALSDSEFDESKPSIQPQVRKMLITYEESNDDFEDNSISCHLEHHVVCDELQYLIITVVSWFYLRWITKRI